VRGARPPGLAEGLRAAYPTNRGVGFVLASGMTAVAAFVAAVVFGASLTSLLATPASYGWPWDVATVDNYGYGGISLHAVRHTLHERDDVARWTALGFSNSIKVDRDAIPAVFGFDQSSSIDVPVVSGRLPTARDEIALGARTASDEGIGVGDHVSVAGFEVTPRSARVTGIVVLPPLGPFQADRAAPGVGVLIPEAMLDRKQLPTLVSFVGVALRPGADRGRAFSELEHGFSSWDPEAITNFDFSHPVRPAEIIDARSMRSSPMLVGGLLVLGATMALAVGIAMSVRGRRRELAVLRVLGFTRGQLRGSVIVQALALATAAVVVGAPLGVVLGRAAWRAFASRLGVLTEPSVPLGWIVATLVGAWIVAMLAAAVPARSAARHHPATDLRPE
jgi:hypothetical protein